MEVSVYNLHIDLLICLFNMPNWHIEKIQWPQNYLLAFMFLFQFHELLIYFGNRISRLPGIKFNI